MKKEAVNSFSGGLNYDLNPITTPNNVLTDAVNATFITFNGDEMALQNDAGNTKILVSEGSTVTTTGIKYGRLYNWYAAVDPRGIAPTGWHVPSKSEWDTLVSYLGGDPIAGGKLKKIGTDEWDSPNGGSNNSTNFSAVGSGVFIPGNGFSSIKYYCYFMSITDTPSYINRQLDKYSASISLSYNNKKTGISVRLIKDNSTNEGDVVIDGDTYHSVTIGNQVWLQQNLAVRHYQNGDLIGSDFSGTVGAVTAYNNDEINVYGSSTITIPAKYVNLTEGFYPIGIKEFGGVLYIVSGKAPSSTLWSVNSTYALNTFVYDTNGIYYKSLINNNDQTLPSYTNESWERIESWNLFVNVYGQIEFGSYPSPQILTEESKSNGLSYTFNNPTSTSLFTTSVINNYLFKSGEYVTFSGVSLDTTNVTIYKYTNNVLTSSILKIYNVKLFLQLTNGFIDLTNNVWDSYAQFVKEYYNEDLNQSTTRYWFNDSNFKYYCRSNYKGKLLISIELEDLTVYKLNYYSVILTDAGYEIDFNVPLINDTTWNIQYIQLNYSLDNIPQTPVNFSLSSGNIYTLILPFSDDGKNFAFELTPIFYNPGTTTNVNLELPQVYLTKYTLSDSEVISALDYDTTDYDSEDYE